MCFIVYDYFRNRYTNETLKSGLEFRKHDSVNLITANWEM